MRNLKRIVVAAALVTAGLCLGAAPSHAGGRGHHHHHHHGGRSGVVVHLGGGHPGWYPYRAWGGPVYYRPYPYAYRYDYGYYAPPPVVYAPPPVIVREPAPVYVERGGSPEPDEAYWYYCPSRRDYYPKVGECPEPWVKVAPTER